MEFPVRCFTCLAVIGNKHETYFRLLGLPFSAVEEWAEENTVRQKAFQKHVILPRQKTSKTSKETDRTRLSAFEILSLLNVKRYCCRTLFLTYVDIPLPDPDYLERTFPRVKFLNKRHRDDSIENEKKQKDLDKMIRARWLKNLWLKTQNRISTNQYCLRLQ